MITYIDHRPWTWTHKWQIPSKQCNQFAIIWKQLSWSPCSGKDFVPSGTNQHRMIASLLHWQLGDYRTGVPSLVWHEQGPNATSNLISTVACSLLHVQRSLRMAGTRSVRLAYQPLVNSIFLSEQGNYQQLGKKLGAHRVHTPSCPRVIRWSTGPARPARSLHSTRLHPAPLDVCPLIQSARPWHLLWRLVLKSILGALLKLLKSKI
jgi:hypothetical protein